MRGGRGVKQCLFLSKLRIQKLSTQGRGSRKCKILSTWLMNDPKMSKLSVLDFWIFLNQVYFKIDKKVWFSIILNLIFLPIVACKIQVWNRLYFQSFKIGTYFFLEKISSADKQGDSLLCCVSIKSEIDWAVCLLGHARLRSKKSSMPRPSLRKPRPNQWQQSFPTSTW